MANRNAVFGGKLVGHLYGSTFNARIRPYLLTTNESNALYVGDAVKPTGTGATNLNYGTMPTITKADAGDTLVGFIVGFAPESQYLNQLYRTASTERIAYVCDDPFALFEIQTNGTAAVTDFGANADIVLGTGNNLFGTSGTQLNQASVDPASGQLRIMELSSRADNEIGLHAKMIVMINEHVYKQTVGV